MKRISLANSCNDYVYSVWTKNNLSKSTHTFSNGSATETFLCFCCNCYGWTLCGYDRGDNGLQSGHDAYQPGTATFQHIVKQFGMDLVDDNGAIDRRILGQRVFADEVRIGMAECL